MFYLTSIGQAVFTRETAQFVITPTVSMWLHLSPQENKELIYQLLEFKKVINVRQSLKCFHTCSLIWDISIFTGASSHSYVRGSFAHQLHKELDIIRNQRNKLGKCLCFVSGLMHIVLGPRTLMKINGKDVGFLHIADRQPLPLHLP